MPRNVPDLNPHDMWHELVTTGHELVALAAIVQNDNMQYSHADLNTYTLGIATTMQRLTVVHQQILDYVYAKLTPVEITLRPATPDDLIAAMAEVVQPGGQLSRSRPYSGQRHTDAGVRGATLVHGLTMRDVADCYLRAFIFSHETTDRFGNDVQPNRRLYDEAQKGDNAVIAPGDLYSLKGSFDPIAVKQNLTCEIERAMGIFPNVPELRIDNEQSNP